MNTDEEQIIIGLLGELTVLSHSALEVVDNEKLSDDPRKIALFVFQMARSTFDYVYKEAGLPYDLYPLGKVG